MVEKNCSLNEIFIEQYADKELDFKESSEVASHLNSCEHCRKKFESILLTKKVITSFYSQQKLSLIEKEGFFSLIDQNTSKNRLLSKIFRFIKSHGFTVAFSTFSLCSMIFAFVFSLYMVENENRLVIKEIIAAHNNSFPDDITDHETVKKEILKKFKIDLKTMANLTSISPKLKGRYTSIAASPATKLKLEGLKNNEKGTLFLSKKNNLIKNIFNDSDCLVKSLNDRCKAKLRKEDGNDIIFWEELDNNFVFVTDNSKMSAQIAQLISDGY